MDPSQKLVNSTRHQHRTKGENPYTYFIFSTCINPNACNRCIILLKFSTKTGGICNFGTWKKRKEVDSDWPRKYKRESPRIEGESGQPHFDGDLMKIISSCLFLLPGPSQIKFGLIYVSEFGQVSRSGRHARSGT
jgi:hypothetical protein